MCRLCTQAKIWLGAGLSSASLYLSVLTKKSTLTLVKSHRETRSCPYNPFLLQSSSAFLSLKKALPVSSLICLRLIYPHFVLAPPITSISIFLFQLWILRLELWKLVSTSLWGTDSRISGIVAVPIMLEIIYQTLCLFQSDILLLVLQLFFTKPHKTHSGCFFNIPTTIPPNPSNHYLLSSKLAHSIYQCRQPCTNEL